MRKKTRKKIVSLLLIIAMFVLPLNPISSNTALAAERHGRDRTRRVNSPNNKVPDGYDVNPDTQGKAADGEYNKYFLKGDIQEVKVEISNNNLDYVLQHANDEGVALADSVTIGGVKVKNVGFKTKGQYTRNVTNNTDSDRFSFTIGFNKFVKKKNGYSKTQNFFGCKKISFNNFYNDKSMLKEYAAFKAFSDMGLPSPQYGLAKLYINDELFGVYFMVENIDESILEQYLKSSKVSPFIMKPESISPRLKDNDFAGCFDENGEITYETLVKKGYITEKSDGTFLAKKELANYEALWEKDSDNFNDCIEIIPKVITWLYRLTQLSNGKDFSGNKIDVNSDKYIELLGQVIDIDEFAKYFAVHSFVVQMDNMFTWRHNYALYIDENAKAMLIPWDYDLAWGSDSYEAETVMNLDIDKMYNSISGMSHFYSDDYKLFYGGEAPYTKNDGYPMFNVLYQNDSLREKFHKNISDCARVLTLGGETSFEGVFASRRLGNAVDRIYDKLIEAASEPLGKNIYYLQYNQPADAKKGAKGLKQAVSRRSVGTWLQANGIDARVTGYGYSAGCLGSDSSRGKYSSGGNNIAVVDDETGIFTIADYDGSKQSNESDSNSGWNNPWNGGWNGGWNQWPGMGPGMGPGAGPGTGSDTGSGTDDGQAGPELSGEILENGSSVKETIQSLVDEKTDEKNSIVVYKMANTKKAKSDYKIYIPVPSAESVIYLYDEKENEITELIKEKVYDNHTAVVSAKDFKYLVVADLKENVITEDLLGPNPKFPKSPAEESGNKIEPETSSLENDSKLGQAEKETNNPDGTVIESSKKDTKKDSKPSDVSISKIKKNKGTSVKVFWKKNTDNSGYVIGYSLKKSFKNPTTKTVNGKNKKTVKIKGLKRKKTYYFKIKSYIKMSSNVIKYGDWSKSKKVKL